MITSISKRMMRRSFERTRYRFTEMPRPEFRGTFGIYVHVPFCFSKCSFCPFYKELFSEGLKARYLDAVVREIDSVEMRGEARWVYVGGGTPNTLAPDELGLVLERIRRKVGTGSAGVELLPALLDEEYLKGLKAAGFTKVSIGVESFSGEVITGTGRRTTTQERVGELVGLARSLGFWVNADMMVGLPGQHASVFASDIEKVSAVLPDQITIYPFMVIRGVKAEASCPAEEQFRRIEKAWGVLRKRGYARSGVWTFCAGDDIYDSSRDELIEDYAGFGPSAFSTYGGWKVVNPELELYLDGVENGRRMGFVAPKSKATDEWRKFARMLYDLRLDDTASLPHYIRLLVSILRLAGYAGKGALTGKGVAFAHAITKTVVESLPFPIQNPGCVENYGEYAARKEELHGASAAHRCADGERERGTLSAAE